MTQTTDAALVERLRKRLADASPQPWAYRPKEYDDWGMIRGPERHSELIGPYQPIVARGHDSEATEEQQSAHRKAKTDPYGPNALLITDAVNALPGLLDTIEAQARRIEALEGALRECADDLEVEVAERYKGWGDHPAIAPKVERDMAPVEAARALLAQAPTP